jgi:molybdenum cofactor cytidylyltransferase
MSALRDALGMGQREVVAFVGAGGKTTAMFRLARELHAAGESVVVTTTTRIFVPEPDPEREVIVEADRQRLLAATAAALQRRVIPVAAASLTADGKLRGLSPEWVGELATLPAVRHVLVEADGAARMPITAPRDGEPVIPPAATLVVAVVGADALGRRVAEVAHRPERVMALTGRAGADALDAQAIARVLLGEDGNTRGAPRDARVVALVNKADDAVGIASARAIAAALAARGASRVVIASLESRDAIVDVIAAQTTDSARTGRRDSR